jgi:hypothetical protein
MTEMTETEVTETEVTEATEKGVKRGGAEDKEQQYSPLLLGLRFSAFMLFSVASLISVSVPPLISVSVASVTSVSVSPVAVR